MSYEPQEGIDYVIDLYAVAGVLPDEQPEEIKRSINQRLVEYHPDRLQGLAPEFIQKGERMARLLNRAKVILLDTNKRWSYDEVMAEWQGPISTDGTPIITINRHLQAEMERKTPEEIESIFEDQTRQIEAMTGYSPSRLSFLEKLIAQAGNNLPDDLREEYEQALLLYDRTLAIQEAERSRLLGVSDIGESGFRAGLDYSEQVAGEIEAARVVRKEELRMQALGGFSARLALLAGEHVALPTSVVAATAGLELPAYFEQQAEKIQELAQLRQSVVEKRLANFVPFYPEANLQEGQAKSVLAIGIGAESYSWFGVVFNQETCSATVEPLPEEVTELLSSGDYKAVIEGGCNVLTFAPLEQIDIGDQLREAIEKHAEKYSIGAKQVPEL